jgi:hypothetical protein
VAPGACERASAAPTIAREWTPVAGVFSPTRAQRDERERHEEARSRRGVEAANDRIEVDTLAGKETIVKLILLVVAGALLAAVLIAANWGATDGGPAYPSGRQAGTAPPIPTYVVPVAERTAPDPGR